MEFSFSFMLGEVFLFFRCSSRQLLVKISVLQLFRIPHDGQSP
jgi:hypothetical protein